MFSCITKCLTFPGPSQTQPSQPGKRRPHGCIDGDGASVGSSVGWFWVWHVLTWQCVGNSDFRRLEGMWLERCNFRKSWTNRELRASSTISYNFANEGLYQLHVVNCLELCWPMMTPSSHTKPHVTVSSIETAVSFHLPFSSCRFCPLAKTGSMAGYCTW